MIEDHLTCPITKERFIDPVIADDGNTYDRNSMDETKPSACVPTNFTGQMKATQSPFLI